MTRVKLEPAAHGSRVKHSSTALPHCGCHKALPTYQSGEYHFKGFINSNANQKLMLITVLLQDSSFFKLALLYNFTSLYTNIPSCMQDESKTSFPLQEGIFVYSQVFVQ